MDAHVVNSRTLVLSTAPHNFAGAGAAHARTLELLSLVGARVEFWVPQAPFRQDALEQAGVKVNLCKIKSDAYPNSDSLTYGRVTEALAEAGKRWLEEHPANRVVLFATYLFPFCAAIETAARILAPFAGRVDCVLNPAGSDIWQVGRQLPNVARQLIESEHVSAVVTYSEGFAREIQTIIGSSREIGVIPPAIDVETFGPLSPEERTAARLTYRFEDDDFVIAHCSNHRPVKGLEHVIDIAVQFAAKRTAPVHLLMVGPMTNHLRKVLLQVGVADPGESLPYRARVGSLQILCTGLELGVRRLHAIGDVALNASLHDSFNISLAEAMACGVPVLTSDVAGVASIVKRYECGATFSFGFNPIYALGETSLCDQSTVHANEAIDWLLDFASNREARRALGRCARKAVVETCSDEVVARMWCGLTGLEYRRIKRSDAASLPNGVASQQVP